MPRFLVKAEDVVTYIFEVEAETIEDAIASVEDGDEDDCHEVDNTGMRAVEYTIEGQMGWNEVKR